TGETIEETLIGRLQDKPFSIATAYGIFVVEGDPVPEPADKAKAKSAPARGAPDEEAPKPPSHPLGRPLERREDFAINPAKGLTQFHLKAKSDQINFFDARALLRQISVVLPNERARNGFIRDDGLVWSRLEFKGSEIAFRLDLPEETWPSARGIVTLGEA